MPGHSSKWDNISTNKNKFRNILLPFCQDIKKLIKNIYPKHVAYNEIHMIFNL